MAHPSWFWQWGAALLIFTVMTSEGYGFCFEEAGAHYGISALLLRTIAKVESGLRPDALHHNPDGSYDFGLMQINSSWAPILGKDSWLSLDDPCTNVKVGAWILAQCIRSHGYTWEAVGCYNASSRAKRIGYAGRVYRELTRPEMAGNGR